MENPFNVEKPVRPTFLIVLCILTFIGSGWGLINNLFQLAMFTPERLVAQIQQITTMAGTETQPSWVSSMLSSSLEVLQTTIMHGKAIYSLAALCAVISLIGAFMNVQAKKEWFLFVRGCADRAIIYHADLLRLEQCRDSFHGNVRVLCSLVYYSIWTEL